MRNILCLLAAVALIAAAAWVAVRQWDDPTAGKGMPSDAARQAAAAPEARSAPPVASRAPAPPRRAAPAGLPELPEPVPSPHPPGSAEHREWIEARIEALDELATHDDPESMRLILAELTHPNRELRRAALEAVIHFGSRDAVPYLRALAERCDDSGEELALDEAADHLELETVTEFLKRRRAGR